MRRKLFPRGLTPKGRELAEISRDLHKCKDMAELRRLSKRLKVVRGKTKGDEDV